MDKKELERKVAGLLNVEEEFQELAFSQFKKKLSEFLAVDEAVKINSIGVFQIKEQLDRSDEHGKISSKDKSLTLVFSPESRSSEEDSIFLNLELDETTFDDNEFDENVLQIGIDKPLVTTEDSETDISSINNDLAVSISALLSNSEKMEKFDLWDDHLKSKEKKDIIEDLEDTIDLTEPKEKLNEVEEALYEKDFVEMDENEIFDEIIEETDLMTDEDLSEIIKDDDELIEDESPQLIDDLEKVTEDFSSELNNSIKEEEVVVEEIDESIEEEKPNKNFIDEIDLEMKAENFGELEDIKEDKIEEPTVADPKLTKEEFENLESEIDSNKDFDEGSTDFKPPENKEVKYKIEKKKKSPWIYLLLALFFIVAAFAIYYLFFDRPISKFEQQEAMITEQIEEVPLNTDQNTIDPTNDTELEKTTEVPAEVENSANNTPNETESRKLSSVDDEKEVAENIYFDGFVYNVQVSSWKQRRIADREAQKLIDTGFPAFVLKVYIPRFNSDWHRVRIGPYPSIKAAKEAQQELN